MTEANPVEIVRHAEMVKKVKMGWLARLINNFYLSLGQRLYEQGYVSEMADTDALTGLYNRNFFDHWMSKILAQANRSGVTLAFVYMDVNDLKKVNDQEGHNKGDLMLRRYSKALVKGYRISDLLFRIGGDEFVAVLWGCSKELAVKKTAAIQKKLAIKKGIHFSFGVA